MMADSRMPTVFPSSWHASLSSPALSLDSLVTAYMTASDSLPGQLLHPEAVLGEDVGEAEPVPGQHLAMTMMMMLIVIMMIFLTSPVWWR